jgi:hypothetical protein
MKYRTRIHRFGDRVKNLSCEATTEDGAREEYHDMREKLAQQGGGSIGLFEAYKKDPLLAERGGQEPSSEQDNNRKYQIRIRRFGERVRNVPCEATTESEALEEYRDMKESLAAQQGGSIGLFEAANKKEPLLAERVGNPPAPALEKEATGAHEPARTRQKERVQAR